VAGFDVGIIGAGVHGAAAAFHLAPRGLRVGIFERWGPAEGPTGRSSAVCRAYYTNLFLARAAHESIEMMARFPEITAGRESDLVRTGMLFLHPPEDEAGVRETAPRLNEVGITTDVLDPAELKERFPEFDLDGIGVGAFERDAGHADPVAVTTGLFQRAVELGVEPHLGTAVGTIEARPTGGATLETAAGEHHECERLLIAAGPWTGALTEQMGLRLPLTVERHVVATFRWGAAAPVTAHADLVGGYYFRPEGQNRFLAGPVHAAAEADPENYSDAISASEVESLADPITARVPHLVEAEPAGGWAGLYDVSPDWQPVIGEVAPGIFVDAGTSGHGFKIAPALGRHVAGLVAGDVEDPGIHEFHPRRFAEGRELSAGYRDARILG
jgi:glycine/D-amino acid oxidase-like deaminating enzyme